MNFRPTTPGRRFFFFFLSRTTALQQVNPRERPSLATTVTFQFCSNINAPETALMPSEKTSSVNSLTNSSYQRET